MSQFSRDIQAVERYLRAQRRAYMQTMGLKGIHARLFGMICAQPGCSQDQLAKGLGFDKSTIGRKVETLEELGYVTRCPAQNDKRILCVYPTERMLAAMPGLEAAIRRWDDALLAPLSAEKKTQLQALLGKICQRAEREAQE